MRTLEDIFPYPKFRKHQRNLIDFIYTTLIDDKIGIVYAPTGIGKTISVLVAHLLDPKEKLIVLTRTKNQSAIYAKEIRKIKEKIDDKISFVFIRSKHELCALAHKSEKIKNLPYSVFLRICERMKSQGKCKFYKRSVSDGQFTDRLVEITQKFLPQGGTVQQLIKIGLRHKLCPYEIARYLAKTSNIIVGTYSYIFNPKIREIFLSGVGLSLSEIRLVIDESHNLPSFIEQQHIQTLSTVALDLCLRKIKYLPQDECGSYIDIIYETVKDINEKLKTKLSAEEQTKTFFIDISDIMASVDQNVVDKIFGFSYLVMNEDPELSSILIRLGEFVEYYLSKFNEDTYTTIAELRYSERFGFYHVIRINLLDPSLEAKKIFRNVKSAILMSGSLHPLEYYRITLSLSEPGIYERTSTAIFPSPFPRHSLRVYVDVTLTSRYEERTPKMYSLYAERIEKIISSLPKNLGALVVFPSYLFLNEVVHRTHLSRPMIIEHKKTKIREVKTFLRESPSTVIFCVAGGKLAEGIDYRINDRTLIKSVIIAGLPFPEYSLILRKKQKYYEEKFGNKFISIFITSIAPMVRSIIQAAGRLIRAENDRGVVFILDKRFSKYSRYFPKTPWQIYEPFRHEHTLENILSEISRFLQRAEEY